MKKSSLVCCLVFFLFVNSYTQNIFDTPNTLKFANYLYSKKNYPSAIIEYNRAWLLETITVSAQKELFQCYLFSKKYTEGIERYRSKYPLLLSNNDTTELILGKLLVSAGFFKEALWLSENSVSLSTEQSLYIKLSADLSSGNWNSAVAKQATLRDYPKLESFNFILTDIEQLKHKSPVLSMSLSTVVPGLGKVYSGYWKDGVVSFLVFSLTAWQAYRGFEIYGSSRAYGWIYASLSTTFYFGNIYGSFKAANKRNFTDRQTIFDKVENANSEIFTF